MDDELKKSLEFRYRQMQKHALLQAANDFGRYCAIKGAEKIDNPHNWHEEGQFHEAWLDGYRKAGVVKSLYAKNVEREIND